MTEEINKMCFIYNNISIPTHKFTGNISHDSVIHMTYDKMIKMCGEPILDFMSHRFADYSDRIYLINKLVKNYTESTNTDTILSLGRPLNEVFVQWRIKNRKDEIIAVVYNEFYNYYPHVKIEDNRIILPTFSLCEELEYDKDNFCIDAINENIYHKVLQELDTRVYHRVLIREGVYIDTYNQLN